MEVEVGPLIDLCEPGLPPFLQAQSNDRSEHHFEPLGVTGFDQSTNSIAAAVAEWLGSSCCSMDLGGSVLAHDRSLHVVTSGPPVATNGAAPAAPLKQGLIPKHVQCKSPPKITPGACQLPLVPSSMNHSVGLKVVSSAFPVFDEDRDVNWWLTQF